METEDNETEALQVHLFRSMILKVGSQDQGHQHNLITSQKCKLSTPTPEIPSEGGGEAVRPSHVN